MTGPEHYREAERDLERAAEAGASDFEVQYHQARAQVHATLALAAATVDVELGAATDWGPAVGLPDVRDPRRED